MGMTPKDSFIQLFAALFRRGEMVKAERLFQYCVPVDVEDDPDILKIQKEMADRLQEIRNWHMKGRPKPSDYSFIQDISKFPKFVLATEKIQKYGGKTLLDLGCYTGGFVFKMKELGYECTGVDIHRDLMKELEKKYNGNPQFFFYRLEEIGRHWTHKFDVVTAFDVLEHCVNLAGALEGIERVAKPDGLIIINLPRMIPGYQDDSFEHLRMFSDKYIKQLFSKKRNYSFELSQDELGRPTSFITYQT